MKSIIKSYSHINLDYRKYGIFTDKRSKPVLSEIILKSDPLLVDKYDNLVKYVAQIQYRSRNMNLFFRGQSKDYMIDGKTVIMPSIYRFNADERNNLKQRFGNLEKKVDELRHLFNSRAVKFVGTQLINKYPEIAWAMLQHYEICPTPLLDITHSLHVACSFAFDRNDSEFGIIYVLGMPWQNDPIGYNSNEELVNLKLLGVSPPQAQRPYFQEGYLAGPFPNYKLDEPSRINQFDFGRRLVAKFKIPIVEEFWGTGFNRIPSEKLYQKEDKILELCKTID